MPSAIASVIIASSSAVAKVFVIGAIGYASANYPKGNPILPPYAMGAVSKMNFYVLALPLIYATLASSVTPEKLGPLWFVLVSGAVVISLSYGVATLLGKLPFFHVENKVDFDALRVAAAFPNIVSLPILIFPTLCEYAVVHDAFFEGDPDTSTEVEKFKSCVDQSNAMIFVYFFAWNFLYWILGYPILVSAGRKRQVHNETSVPSSAGRLSVPDGTVQTVETAIANESNNDEEGDNQQQSSNEVDDAKTEKKFENTNRCIKESQNDAPLESEPSILQVILHAFKQTLTSPGFLAMVLGFITGCIPPLRDALFEPGSSLRFLGSALESLGQAGTSVGTLVVAASLVHQVNDDGLDEVEHLESKHDNVAIHDTESQNICHSNVDVGESRVAMPSEICSPTQSAPRATSYNHEVRRSSMSRRSSVSQFGSMVKRRSSIALAAIRKRKPTIRMHAWFIFSRLIVAPAVICLIIVGMDCGGILSGISPLAKMVIIVNAGLPGAQLIVITLKSKGLSGSASIVAQVYLPSYLLSVVTIAAWTSVGLIVSIPDEDGLSFCNR
ncbi:hypothetical protein ACHAXS_005846 [Conticribra weissflogii]